MSGSTREDMGAIKNQIMVWLGNASFEHEGRPTDRVIEEVAQNPDKYIDPAMADNFMESASANYERIKAEFGLRGATEMAEFLSAMGDMEREQITTEIRDQLNEYGIDQVVDAINQRPGVESELQDRVNDVLQEVPDDAYQAEVRQRVHTLFRALDEPVQIIPEEEAEERRESTREFAEREARREILASLREELGFAFNDIDEAIEEIQRRLEEGRGTAIETGAVRLEVRPGETQIGVDPTLSEWEGAIVREAERILDLSNADALIDPDSDDPLARQASIRIGTVRLENGQLADIDFDAGRDELGAQPGAGEPEIPGPADDDANQLAQSFIDSMEGS